MNAGREARTSGGLARGGPAAIVRPMDSSAARSHAGSRPAGWTMDRREFLRCSALSLAGLLAGAGCAGGATGTGARKPLRFGLIADLHYADREPKGNRFYRESLPKAREAVGRLNAERLSFLGVLGDVKDMAPGESEERTLGHLTAIAGELRRFAGPVHHVLGNHDMDNLSKAQVLPVLNPGGAADRAYHAFDAGGVRFVALDACFRKDGAAYDRGRFDWRDTFVPDAELAWLEAELLAARGPVIVLAHQRLDGSGDAYVKNSEAVRSLLEGSGKVLAVFQGHDHAGGCRTLGGIHYYTLKALVEGSGAENNSYATVEVGANLDIVVTGYRRAVSTELPRPAQARTLA